MWFGELATARADGCILAHSLKLYGKRVAKGTQLDHSLIQTLLEAGHDTVVVARVDAEDVAENIAAMSVAQAFTGSGLRVDKAHTGRVNIYATVDGLLCLDRESVVALNSIDESLTFATLPENTMVLKGRMVATSKIITYAVASRLLQQAVAIAQVQPLQVRPVRAHTAALIQTRLPTVKESTLDKSTRVTQQRLQSRCAELTGEFRCDHNVTSLTRELNRQAVTSADWILVAGASAISDRNDVIPAAIVASGGQITRYGIPVDPGNLLLLGKLGKSIVLGLPGCARSPKYNGLDQVLDRLACAVPIDEQWLNSLSVGGLLAEDINRPQPRLSDVQGRDVIDTPQAPLTSRPITKKRLTGKSARSDDATATAENGADKPATPTIAALVLAAGSSSRAGELNKLLVTVNEIPMVRLIVDVLLQTRIDSVQVVTGHQHDKVEAALDGLNLACYFCPSHMNGMAHSLSHGISRLPNCDAVLVCLGDMPHITPALVNSLLEIVGTQAADVIAVPVYQGRRGNPVIVGKAFFDTLLQHEGDTGARFLMKQYPDRVVEIEVDDSSVVIDYDTAEALNKLTGH